MQEKPRSIYKSKNSLDLNFSYNKETQSKDKDWFEGFLWVLMWKHWTLPIQRKQHLNISSCKKLPKIRNSTKKVQQSNGGITFKSMGNRRIIGSLQMEHVLRKLLPIHKSKRTKEKEN